MTPSELETARALVACPRWQYLPGMLCENALNRRRILRVDGDRGLMGYAFECSTHWHHLDNSHYQRRHGPRRREAFDDFDEGRELGAIGFPYLPDPLTALGVLHVVRLAWNCPHGSVRLVDRPLDSSWVYRGGWMCHAPTEIEALLAALRAAS